MTITYFISIIFQLLTHTHIYTQAHLYTSLYTEIDTCVQKKHAMKCSNAIMVGISRWAKSWLQTAANRAVYV